MPQPLALEDQALAGNEIFKSFPNQDALGKAYVDLKTRVDTGDIGLLPEEVRKDDSFKSFKTIKDLATSYVETKRLVGTIKKAPEKPTDYKFTELKDLHKNIAPDKLLPHLTPLFHAAGIPNESADVVQQGILKLLSSVNVQNDAKREDLRKMNESKLREEWGDKYDLNFDRTSKVLQRALGRDEKGNPIAVDTNELATALKGSPNLFKALNRITSLLSEDSIGKLDAGAIVNQITEKNAAMAEIERLKLEYAKDPNGNPIVNAKHPEHAKAWDEWNRLHSLLN